MTHAAFDQTFEHRLSKIDLSRVMAKLSEEHGITGSDLTAAEDLYRKFLTLKSRYPQLELVPPVLADKVWDIHVQFTRQYAADCTLLFGEFLHHEPHIEADGFDAEGLFVTTKNLYKQDFAMDFTRSGLRPEYVSAAYCT